MFFNERKKSPRPPTASTNITIRSNEVILRKLKRTVDITPNIKAAIDPTDNNQPKIFFELKKIIPIPKINGIRTVPPVIPIPLPKALKLYRREPKPKCEVTVIALRSI